MKTALLPALLLTMLAAAPAHAQQASNTKTTGGSGNTVLDEARQDTSGRPTSVVAREIAEQRARQQLADASGQEKQATAVGIYLGFETINTEGRLNWCKAHGVDITPFVNAFRSVHAEHRRQAVRILGELGIDEKEILAQMRGSLDAPLQQDMSDMMAATKSDEAGVCRLLNENADYLVNALKLPAEVEAALRE